MIRSLSIADCEKLVDTVRTLSRPEEVEDCVRTALKP